MSKTVTTIREEYVHREAIRDCLTSYSRGVDRGDAEILKAVFWPDATDEHVEFSGTAPEFIEYVLPTLGAMDQTFHFLGNMLIDIQGNSAFVETYCQGYHRLRGENGAGADLIVGGRYVDRMELRHDEWRIAGRVVVVDWFRYETDVTEWKDGFLGMKIDEMGRRGPRDRSYRLLKS